MKKNNFSFAFKLAFVIIFVIAIFVTGGVFLDKVVIPKNFSVYGIHNIGELTGVFRTLYSSPKKNTYSNIYDEKDNESMAKKLSMAGYSIDLDGTIDLQDDFCGNSKVELNERELSAVCSRIAESGMMEDDFVYLDYFDTRLIEIVGINIVADKNTKDGEANQYLSADMTVLMKVDTSKLRSQIASNMETTEALLKIIITHQLFFEINFNVSVSGDDFEINDVTLLVNGKNNERSERLMNLLIRFIYPEDSDVTSESFANLLSDFSVETIGKVGDFAFLKTSDEDDNENAIIFN